MEEDKNTEIKPDASDETTPEEPKPTETTFQDQQPAPEQKKDEDELKITFFKKAHLWQATTVIFIVLFIVSLFFISGSGESISQTAAKDRVQNYIDTVLAGRAVATLGDVNEESGLYKVDVNIEGQDLESYITRDGEVFFPTGVILDRILDNPALFTGGAVAADVDMDTLDLETDTEITDDDLDDLDDLGDDEEDLDDDEEDSDDTEDDDESDDNEESDEE